VPTRRCAVRLAAGAILLGLLAVAPPAGATPSIAEAKAEAARIQHQVDRLDTEVEILAESYDANRARLDPSASLVIASKSGWTRQQRNDVGLVTAPGVRYAVALFAEGYPGLPRHPDHPPVLTLQRVSRAIYDHFGGGGTP
jgi:hypothetical protein